MAGVHHGQLERPDARGKRRPAAVRCAARDTARLRYPGYGWERNQGYATREHRDAIRRLGLTPFHRRSFLALQRTLAGDQIRLDLFDEAVASLDADSEVRELDRLDGHGRDAQAERDGVRPRVDELAVATG